MDHKEFEEMKKLFEKKKMLLDTTALVHSEAYDKAVREHLMDGDQVDYGKLKDSATQLKFVDKMAAHYLEVARKNLGATKKGDFEDEMLLSAYFGVTKSGLQTLVNEHRHLYNQDKHNEFVSELQKQQDQKLGGIVYRKLTTEHIPHLVEYVKAGEIVDHNKMQLQDAKALLNVYFNTGVIAPGQVEGSHYAKKKHADAHAH